MVNPFSMARARVVRRVEDCAFCEERLPSLELLTKVFSTDPCFGGKCECGAGFVVDDTGHLGGQALLDAQAIACDGDLDRALTLRDDVDVEIRSRRYTGPVRYQVMRGPRRPTKLSRIWFAKLKKG